MHDNQKYKDTLNRYWVEEAVRRYPPIISEEYLKLKDMVMDNEIYGSILQMKDLFELIIKIPVLIIINGIHTEISIEKTPVPEHMRGIIQNFFSKKLSLGDWELRAIQINKANSQEPFVWTKNSGLYDETLTMLKSLLSNYKVYNEFISNWRNDTIGHGALAFKEDENFFDDYIALNNTLQKLLTVCMEYYSNIRITPVDHSDPDIKISVEGFGCSVEMNPYWIVNNGSDYYLFDCFSIYNRKAYVLNYSHGHKQPYYPLSNYIHELHESLGFALISDKESFVDSATLMSGDMQQIDDLLKRDNLIAPMNLVEWLKRSIHENEKGVFLLEAEKGIGKTTFTRMMDPLDIHNYDSSLNEFDDTLIRVWHFNDTYNSRKDIFINHFLELLRTISINATTGRVSRFVGELETQSMEYAHLIKNSSSKEKALYFAEMVNLVYEAYTDRFPEKEKLLLIFDGIDEIQPDHFQDIMEIIPSMDMIHRNIYLLLTSRTPEAENPRSYVGDWLKQITFTASCQYTADRFIRRKDGLDTCIDNSDYLKLLEDYAKKNVLCYARPYSAEDVDHLLQRSEYRFLYLYAYELIYKSARQNTLSNTKLSITSFMEMIRVLSGDRYYQKLLRLMTILTMAPTSLSVSELLYLYGEPKLTFQIYGVLTDMKCFLESTHTRKGTLLSLSHMEWKNELMSSEACIREWERVKSDCKELFTSLYHMVMKEGSAILFAKEYAGELWLLEHIDEILKEELQVPAIGYNMLDTYNAYCRAVGDESSYVNQFIMQYAHIIQSIFEDKDKLCNSLLSLEWEVILEQLGEIYRCVAFIANGLRESQDASLSEKADLLTQESNEFLKQLTGQIEHQADTRDRIISFYLAIYHCRMWIGSGYENVTIAEQINSYNLEVHGPASETTFYSYYLFIIAYNEDGDFQRAYDIFRIAYDNFKAYEKMDSPLLADCIAAVHNSLYDLPEKEEEKVQLMQMAYDIRRKSVGEDAPATIYMQLGLATSYIDYADVCTDQELKEELLKKSKDLLTGAYRKPMNDYSRMEIKQIFRSQGWGEPS